MDIVTLAASRKYTDKKIMESGAVGIKSDWNQNDDTKPDYIKNRPFYTGDPIETVFVEESTVEFADDGSGIYIANVELTFEPTARETYKVSWDGTVYECLCATVNGLPAIGNLAIIGMGPDTGEPFMIGVDNGYGIFIFTADTSASHTFSISRIVAPVVKIDKKYLPDNPLNITGAAVDQIAKISAVDAGGKPTEWVAMDISNFAPAPFKPAGKSYLTFSSSNSFTMKVADATKHWDGTLEYFASDKTWTVWDGTSILSSVVNDSEYVIYLRGIENTVITGNNSNYRWVLTGTNIKCIGDIENLLNHAMVKAGNHPMMANYCYNSMFYGCTSLTQAPSLPATTLAEYCYYGMFDGCTSLTQAPSLPATTLAEYCYMSMFNRCSSLTQAPSLPATTLAGRCYNSMFYGCTSLTQAPSLPATTLAKNCYALMFRDCTSLTQAPALPATTLADYCYMNMFYGCTSLTQAPSLPATTLAKNCYYGMFNRCSNLKLSSTKTDEYAQEYRIPSSGNGTTATDALTSMFASTGGTFKGTPSINTTYYLSSDNIVVRKTEIATLNGYIRSMIDTALSKIGVAEEGAY